MTPTYMNNAIYKLINWISDYCLFNDYCRLHIYIKRPFGRMNMNSSDLFHLQKSTQLLRPTEINICINLCINQYISLHVTNMRTGPRKSFISENVIILVVASFTVITHTNQVTDI